jgi:hypothetical protein
VADTADINGGTIDGTTIGATTPAAGTFSQVNSDGAVIATGAGSFGDDTDITGDLTVVGAIGVDGGASAGHIYTQNTATGTGNTDGLEVGIETAGANGYVWNYEAGDLYFGAGNSQRIRIKGDTGNVGIGTSAPSTFRTKVLEVADTNNAGIVVNGDATNAYASLRLTNSGTSGWDLNYNFPNAGDLGFFDIGAADTRMTITSTGNVGIGTASPATKLHVQTATNGGIVVNDGTVNGIIYGSTTLTNSFAIGTTSNHPLIFGTNNSFPQMTLTTAGNFGVGTENPNSKLTILGDDEETAAINTATPTTLEVSGNGASVNSGGAIVFSANRASWKFAAIKSLVQSGTANTVGDLAFSTRNATGDSTLTERMRITYGGNVGVGLSAPTDKLHVGGALRVDSWIGGNSSTGKLTLYGDREATQGVTILDSGNVGIGTSAPARKLTVVGAADQTMTIGNDGPSMSLTNDASNPNAAATTGLLALATSSGQYGLNAGELMVATVGASRGNIVVNSNYSGGGTNRHVILQPSSGRVGIGTSTPAHLLTVVEASTDFAALINNVTSSGNGLKINAGSNSGDSILQLNDKDGNGKMRVLGNGDVILSGTTMPTVGVGGFAWDNVNEYVRFGKMGAGVQTQAIFISATQTCGSITTNQTTTAYNTSSDYRLKENVVPMSDALQRIGNLKPSRFNFISDDSVVVDGFIAHEVQEVVPEAISGEKDAVRDEEYEVTPAVLDDDGNEITPAVMDTRSVPEYQGIDQSKLVPLLVGAVQELTARLEALENN